MEKQKKQLLKKVWYWIKLTSLLLGLICSSVLIYNWWTKRQQLKQLQTQLKELQEQAQQQYQLQNIHLVSTDDLVNGPKVQAFFSDLLRNYAEKFASSKSLDISHLPLNFAGFYSDKKIGSGYGEMGRCFTEKAIYPIKQKIANISLNRLYLLNKFGHDRYFTDYPQGDYSYLDISFNKMIETCSHELAHYIQFVKHGRSSCESDLKLENGNYDEELAREHEKFGGEIYHLIKQDYSEWERQWKEI